MTKLEELWIEVENIELKLQLLDQEIADNELLLNTSNCKSISWRECLVSGIEKLKAERDELQTRKNTLSTTLDEIEFPKPVMSYHVNHAWYYSLDSAVIVARAAAIRHRTIWAVQVINHTAETQYTLYINPAGQYIVRGNNND